MDGQVLGYSAETEEGAIKAESGDRFTFKKSDWRGERDPKAGDKVDFVGADGVATEIYLVKGSFSGPDLSGIGDKLGDSEARAEMVAAVRSNEAVGLFLTKPHVAGAGLIILGWIFAGHLLLITSVAEMHDGMNQMSQFVSGGIGIFRTLGVWTLLAMYLIPVFSGWLIYKSFSDSETAKHKGRAAWSGIAFPIVVPIVAFILIILGLPGQIRDMIFEGIGQAGNSGMDFWSMIDIDFGWALMIVGGVLILLQRMGIVTSFGGK